MFNHYTTIQQMQSTLWDFYKDVHGMRPRHWTEQEWNSRQFLQEQYDNLTRYLDSMSPAQKIADGWGSGVESESPDDGADAEALASAGWGTDEDYGGYSDDI